MNQIRAIQALNKREIEAGISPNASWHVDYRDTAFVNFGGLPYDLSEGDVITIFSQFGEPVFLKLVRDAETGKSKGFGWLKYEDQRSTDLAVDNLGGAEIGGRLVRVDHARYRPRDDEDPAEFMIGWEDMRRRERGDGTPGGSEEEDEEEKEVQHRPLLKEEIELRRLIENHDDEDPMKAFLVDEKKKEVAAALEKETRRAQKHSRSHRSHRHRSHRERSVASDEGKHRSRRSDRDRDHDRDRRRDDKEDRDSRRHRHRSSRDRETERDGERSGRTKNDRDREEDDRRHRHRRDASKDRYGDRRDGDKRHDKDRNRSRTRSPRLVRD